MYLIDCTLRDGGNLNNWNFSPIQVENIVNLLDKTGVDIVEVGYRGGSGSKQSNSSGIVSQCPAEFLCQLPKLNHATYAVMIVPSVTSHEQADDLIDTPVRWVRVASYPRDATTAYTAISHLKKRGMKVSFNLMSVSYIGAEEAASIAFAAQEAGADVVYIADSFGALPPTKVYEYIQSIVSKLTIPAGFHGHNNLGLAFTNALAALDARAQYLDASLCGMARGAGNLATEQIISAMDVWLGNKRSLDVRAVLDAAEFVFENFMKVAMPVRRQEIECGLGDLHYYSYDQIHMASKNHGVDRLSLARTVGALRPAKVNDDVILEAVSILKNNLPGAIK